MPIGLARGPAQDIFASPSTQLSAQLVHAPRERTQVCLQYKLSLLGLLYDPFLLMHLLRKGEYRPAEGFHSFLE